jgi:hypothetical protein
MHAIWRLSRRCRPADRGGRHGLLGPAGGGAPSGDTIRGRGAHPEHRLAVRRPSAGRARRHRQAVHRRPRRVGRTSRDSRGRDVQPHALLHRQGAGARVDVRVVEAVREGSQRGLEDRQLEGARRDRADVARSAVPRPHKRQGRHGRGHGHRHARARETGRLLRADAHQRQ